MEPRKPPGWSLVECIPLLIAAIGCLPALPFPFLFDDYDFLGRAQVFDWSHLLPDSGSMYWRPVSRDLYFTGLYLLGPGGALAGHILNLSLLLLSTYLVMDVAKRLFGRVAGLVSGVLFATYPHMSVLVAWVSGSQDLLAMVFLLLAVQAQFRGGHGIAAFLFVLAVLSKESVISIVPVLASFHWLLGRRPARLLPGWLLFGGIAVGWALVHPGIRRLVHDRLILPPGGFIGFQPESLLPSLSWGIATVLNLPTRQVSLDILRADLLQISLAAALGFLAFRLAKNPRGGDVQGPSDMRRRLAFAMLLGALPLIATTTLVHTPSPYYGCIPFIGTSLVLGLLISRLEAHAVTVCTLALVALGGVARAALVDPGIPTLRNLAPAAAALDRIEPGFKSLVPTIAGDAVAYVSVQSAGHASVSVHMHRLQSLRVWYRNPGLVTLSPETWRPTTGREYLFWVSPALDVFAIDPETLRPLTTGRPVSVSQYEKVLRRHAVSRAAGGDLPAAVSILIRLDSRDRMMRAYDWRLAGALLLAGGREGDAKRILADVPEFKREAALDFVMTTIGEYFTDRDVDDSVMRAFGIDPLDSGSNRSLMRGLDRYGWKEPALRFARRVASLNPADDDAERIIRTARNAAPAQRMTTRVESFDQPSRTR